MVFDPLGRTRGCAPGDLYFLRGRSPFHWLLGALPDASDHTPEPWRTLEGNLIFFREFLPSSPQNPGLDPTVEPASPMPSNREPGSDGISPGELMQSSSKLAGRVVGVLLKLFKNIDLQNWSQKDECCCRYSQQYGESLC